MEKVLNMVHVKTPIYLVEKWVYSSHQRPKVTGLREVSKAKPAKADVVFSQADRSQLSKERVTWTCNLAFRLLTPLSLPPCGLRWPFKSTPAVGFHLRISHRCLQKKTLETVLYRCNLNLKTFYKGPTDSHLIAQSSGEKESFYIPPTLAI